MRKEQPKRNGTCRSCGCADLSPCVAGCCWVERPTADAQGLCCECAEPDLRAVHRLIHRDAWLNEELLDDRLVVAEWDELPG